MACGPAQALQNKHIIVSGDLPLTMSIVNWVVGCLCQCVVGTLEHPSALFGLPGCQQTTTKTFFVTDCELSSSFQGSVCHSRDEACCRLVILTRQ